MIHSYQLVTGLMTGIAAIVFGLLPGLLRSFVDGFLRLVDALQAQGFHVPGQPRSPVSIDSIDQPREFALFGLAIIALTLLAYLAG